MEGIAFQKQALYWFDIIKLGHNYYIPLFNDERFCSQKDTR